MRAITVDNELVEYDDNLNTVEQFKEMYRNDAFEEDDIPHIVLLDSATYRELDDQEILYPQIMYLLVVIDDTLLHVAVRNNFTQLAQFLLSKQYVDIQSTDDDDRTALSYCCDPDMATLLIQEGSDVNHQDMDDNTPMHHMLNEMIAEMISMTNLEKIHAIVRTLHVLSWNGADPDIENKDDVTPRILYHTVFPEHQTNDEDGDLKEFFATTQHIASYSSSVAATASCSAHSQFDMEM